MTHERKKRSGQKQIVEYYENQSKAKTEILKWTSEKNEDLDSVGITQADITARKLLVEQLVRGRGK